MMTDEEIETVKFTASGALLMWLLHVVIEHSFGFTAFSFLAMALGAFIGGLIGRWWVTRRAPGISFLGQMATEMHRAGAHAEIAFAHCHRWVTAALFRGRQNSP
jgi:hypothetical protein